MGVRDFKYNVDCNTCGKSREVSYCQKWNIEKGLNKDCISCSSKKKDQTGLKKGRGWNKGLKGFMSGHPAYNDGQMFRGKKHTEDSKEKMRLAKLGKKLGNYSEEHRAKISIALKGKKRKSGSSHYNWKGGITSENKRQRALFRNTCHKQVLERDNFTCGECSKKGINLHVNHIKEWAKFPELRFDLKNCVTLCVECHYRKTYGKEKKKNVVWGNNLKHKLEFYVQI